MLLATSDYGLEFGLLKTAWLLKQWCWGGREAIGYRKQGGKISLGVLSFNSSKEQCFGKFKYFLRIPQN